MNRLAILTLLATLLLFVGCKHVATRGAETGAGRQPARQISANGVDAAEPATAAAPDGSFYVAWVNHNAKEADVMLAHLNNKGEQQGSAVRVNRESGVATACRCDHPSLAVAPDGTVYVLWTARVDANDKHGTDIYLSVSKDRGQSFA